MKCLKQRLAPFHSKDPPGIAVAVGCLLFRSLQTLAACEIDYKCHDSVFRKARSTINPQPWVPDQSCVTREPVMQAIAGLTGFKTLVFQDYQCVGEY